MSMSIRRHLLWFFIFAAICVFIRRTWMLQFFPDQRVLSRLGGQSTTVIQTCPGRGAILDNRGEPLALTVPVTSIYVDPQEWDGKNAEKLKNYLPDDKIKALSGLKKGRFVWLSRQLEDKKAKEIMDLGLEGIHALAESKRVYPGSSLLSHVLGYCDIDGIGLAGLEMIWNDVLYVPPRQMVTPRNRKSPHSQSAAGGVLRLTIDRRVQYITEKHLERVSLEEKASWSAAICLESNTGRVIAMASWPFFDANDRRSMADGRAMVNNCIGRVYEPGSTFKPIVVAMGLHSGVISKSSSFMDQGKIKIADGWISNSHGVGKGQIDLAQTLIYSSNVAMAQIGMKWDPHDGYMDLESWGFGKKSGIELNGEEEGLLLPPEKWYGVIPANIAIGQGIGVTPLQLIMAFNGIVSGGTLLRPHLVDEAIDQDGNVAFRFHRDETREVISPQYADWFRKTLRRVITEGTGKKAEVTSARVAGKTGTAQVAVGGKYDKDRMVSSFMGFWPYDSPKYTLLVVIGESKSGKYYGGDVAAPLFKSIVEDIERLESGE